MNLRASAQIPSSFVKANMLYCEWGWAIQTGSLACHSGISGPRYPCIVSGLEGEVQGVSPDF